MLFVIVFINGPFGIGKTTTAKLVVERISHALIFDPEIIGEILQKLFGNLQPVNDFQEYRLWPILTVKTVFILRAVLRRPLIIPMTITNKDRWQYISKELRSIDSNFICIRLTCSEQELNKRIFSRPDSEGSHQWCIAHIPEGIVLMQEALFGHQIDAEGKTPIQVAEAALDYIKTHGKT